MKKIEDIMVENRYIINDKLPSPNHEEKFLSKLQRRFRKLISIVPYLLWVLLVTILINIIGIIVWNNFIRKDRHEITLKEKVTNIINKIQ
jgi:hypothetical protein